MLSGKQIDLLTGSVTRTKWQQLLVSEQIARTRARMSAVSKARLDWERDNCAIGQVPQKTPASISAVPFAAVGSRRVCRRRMTDDFDDIDPFPDVHALFLHYNELYFDGCLGACSVEWSSSRMTL